MLVAHVMPMNSQTAARTRTTADSPDTAAHGVVPPPIRTVDD
jgi:hypothetical protein